MATLHPSRRPRGGQRAPERTKSAHETNPTLFSGGMPAPGRRAPCSALGPAAAALTLRSRAPVPAAACPVCGSGAAAGATPCPITPAAGPFFNERLRYQAQRHTRASLPPAQAAAPGAAQHRCVYLVVKKPALCRRTPHPADHPARRPVRRVTTLSRPPPSNPAPAPIKTLR
ncbi:MAG: hypothetical protein J3K34DRAFT_86530 [Monoraphidium minutum]|nr:MAG: hypothetical protein J3K34DRAFT_86530 [Monoraphidium minutum]